MIRQELNRLIKKHPESAFAAIYSLSELRRIFLDVMGDDPDDPWSGKAPAAFQERIGEQLGRELVSGIADFLNGLDTESSGRAMHVLSCWCEADTLFRYAMSRHPSNRSRFAAIYSADETRVVFEKFTVSETGNPFDLADTLSPSERTECYFRALDLIAHLSERGQLRYFSKVFTVWPEEATP